MNWVEVLVLLFIFQALALFAATAILTKQAARLKQERDAWLYGFHALTRSGDVGEALETVQERLDESLPFVKAVRVLARVRNGR